MSDAVEIGFKNILSPLCDFDATANTELILLKHLYLFELHVYLARRNRRKHNTKHGCVWLVLLGILKVADAKYVT